MTGRGMTPAGILMEYLCILTNTKHVFNQKTSLFCVCLKLKCNFMLHLIFACLKLKCRCLKLKCN